MNIHLVRSPRKPRLKEVEIWVYVRVDKKNFRSQSIANENSKAPFHRFPLLCEREEERFIETRSRSRLRKRYPRFRSRDPPQGSMHTPSSPSVSGPARGVNTHLILAFDFVTRQRGQCTPRPRFRSHDLPEGSMHTPSTLSIS